MSEQYEVISNWFVNKGIDDEKELSPQKLQNLLYLSHGWHLAIYDEPLLTEEFEAWKFGPMLNELYLKYKNIGNFLITIREKKIPMEEKTEKFLDFIWDRYKIFSDEEIHSLTHQNDSPWKHIVNNPKKNADQVIPNILLKNFYKLKYKTTIEKIKSLQEE